MGFLLGLLIVGAVVAFGMSFAIGANDAANALGTSVGSKALTMRHAIILGAIFEFLGVMIMGGFVSSTLKTKILDPDDYEEGTIFVIGMFSALLSAMIILLLATWMSMPVSTTQTIVGGILGFGLVTRPGDIDIEMVVNIVMSWILTPILSGVLGYSFFYLIHRFILSAKDPKKTSRNMLPYITSLAVGVLAAFIAFSQWKIFKFAFWIVWFVMGVVLAGTFIFMEFIIMPMYKKKLKKSESEHVELAAVNEEEERELEDALVGSE